MNQVDIEVQYNPGLMQWDVSIGNKQDKIALTDIGMGIVLKVAQVEVPQLEDLDTPQKDRILNSFKEKVFPSEAFGTYLVDMMERELKTTSEEKVVEKVKEQLGNGEEEKEEVVYQKGGTVSASCWRNIVGEKALWVLLSGVVVDARTAEPVGLLDDVKISERLHSRFEPITASSMIEELHVVGGTAMALDSVSRMGQVDGRIKRLMEVGRPTMDQLRSVLTS